MKEVERMKTFPLAKWITLFINTVVFLVVEYLLGCAIFSFQHSPMFILFFASDMYILEKHLSFLTDTLSKKVYAYIVLIVTLLLLFSLFWVVGLLTVSTTFFKV